MSLSLRPVDDDLLPRLVDVAVSDAAADEVTPPLGDRSNSWTPQRVSWFEDYHRACRAGLGGERREAAWAVCVEGAPVGCVRLQATSEPGELEIGIWFARSARGRRLARPAVEAALAEARRLGARAVVADTATTNTAARRLLTSLGFECTVGDERVRASRPL